jgi:3-phosphoshikimate 1-carboxyvinyltransferase
MVCEFSFNFVGIMALPELIEIVPLDKPVRAEITVPGSKSITNRALILAALADGEVTLTGALWSEDTQIMVECLEKLGFEIRVENDPEEFCNRTITLKGLGGKIPNSGTIEKPLELFVGNAGTAARFLSALVCLGNGVYRLSGVPRMHERPQAALFQALSELGYRVESEKDNDKLPVKIFGHESFSDHKRIIEPFIPKYQEMLTSEKPRSCKVSIEESSQFASALLLCAKVGNWQVEVVGENAEESPYVAMTSKLIEAFPKNGGTFQIEPDASSGSYFWGAAWLLQKSNLNNGVIVYDWTIAESQWQRDAFFRNYVGDGFKVGMKRTISRRNELADSIMTAIVLAPFAGQPIEFTDLGRLRLQECERVFALKKGLMDCDGKVDEEGDTLTVWPSPLHGAEIETYNDHRMAMCFAILGLKVPGMKIKNPACVKKTFPNFFQKLAAQPPHGLGATILDAKSGRKLTHEELFAD